VALSPGTRLGVYEVIAQIGEGGMGLVYRAHDTTLNRDVALKILPDAFASDPDRLARFQREAQVLASLNHPNIAHLYGLEQRQAGRAGLAGLAGTDAPFLVIELVEGEDLAQRIARGSIPIDEVLPIAQQILEALEAAHEQGVIHRDLKPANIKVRPDGVVKVLDFGLAKAIEGAGEAGRAGADNLSQSPTITTPAMTQAGMILGTAAYMSPEQAKGRPADKRSDVWAFGCVLYEMLTGRRSFIGEDVAETLAHILTKEPDWTALPADAPVAMRRLLRRCLERDRKHRLDSAAAARLEIEEAAKNETMPASSPTSAPMVRSARIPWVVAALATLAALAAVAT
jgi:eukaryotic-like serine/threonine-protein kinase